MKTKITALLLCFLCQIAYAQSPDVRGAPDCSRWLQPENATRELMNKSWLVGYLSGLNMGFALDLRRKPFNYFEGVIPGQIYLWMDNYCRANPLASVIAGSGALYEEMAKK
jgi:hypothetical protein